MAITYPVDVQGTAGQWAFLDTDTGTISRNNSWPNANGDPVNFDPNIVPLLQIVSPKPSYDSRLYILEGTETVDAPNNELRTTWSIVDRPLDEKLTAAKNAEAQELGKHIDVEREVVETRLLLGALLAYVLDLSPLPPKAQTAANRYKQKAVKLWQNRDRFDEIKTQIEANQEPDLDTGWAPVE